MKKLTVMLFAVLALAACSSSGEDSTGDNAPAVEQGDTKVQHTWPCTERGGSCVADGACQGQIVNGKPECNGAKPVCCVD